MSSKRSSIGHGGFSAGSDHRQGRGALGEDGPAPIYPCWATTRNGLLTPPLRDRFGVVLRLEFYSPEELVTIVQRSAAILGMPIDESGALELGRRSRGTPRIANRLLRRVRDFAQVGNHPWSIKTWPMRR